MRTYFKNGSWNCDCDVCGLRFKAEQLVRRWDGAMACKSCYEPRHPQDFIRVRDERISVSFTRPEVDVSIPAYCDYFTSQGIADLGTANCAQVGKIGNATTK